MEDMNQAVQDLIGYFDSQSNTSNEPVNSNPPPDAGSGASDEKQPESEATVTSEAKQASAPSNDKQNQAFAKMRTENAMYRRTMMTLAQSLGIDPNIPLDQLSTQLQNRAIDALAKSKNIDPAILRRIEQLEANNAEYTKVKLRQQLDEAKQTIKDKYGATDDDVYAFLQSLVDEQFDIAAPGVNIESEFVKRNIDKILERKAKDAVREEQARSAKASGASQPSKTTGQDKAESSAITTMAEMNQFLNELKQ